MGNLTPISQLLNFPNGNENSTAKNEPEPETCQFCGASLPWRRREIPELDYVTWFKPGRCTCPGAQEYWAEVDRRAAEEEARRREEEACRRRQALLEKSRLPRRYWTCTFDRTLEISENRQALAKVRKYAEEFSRDSGGLFLTGPVGTGKTHLAACLVNELIGREIRVLFGNVLDLLGRLRRSYDEDGQEEEWRILDELATVPLLVIDDLGKEKVSEWVEQTLYRIVDMRYRGNLPLVVTSNYMLSELEKRYQEVGPALVSRLAEMCKGIRLAGRDWRRTREEDSDGSLQPT